MIRAAGGLLWRPAADGVEVCLVHRARYDDWSLPKGKLHTGEHPLAAAVREVREETGVRGVPQYRLPSVSYALPNGDNKCVDFWSMRAGDTPPEAPDDEVDEVIWLPVAAAAEQLTYPGDADVLRRFRQLPAVTVTVAVVRHGHAGKRDRYPGPDNERPLDDAGRQEARALAPLLALSGPRRLLSATPVRCVQTLDPLAALLHRDVERDPAFDEPESEQDGQERAARSARRLAELAAEATPLVVCSQGKVIPHLLARLRGEQDPEPYRTPKGTGWLLAFAGTDLVALDRLAVEGA